MNVPTTVLSIPFPRVLRYTDIRSYFLTALFVSFGIAVPWGFHQFQLAGATYLPMHIFVLAGGLAFGWRAVLVIGLLSPLASYAVSGMPGTVILPQVTGELAAYGLIAGWLVEKYRRPVVWSLLGAMIGGRLALLVFLSVAYLFSSGIYSPLGLETSPLSSFWTVVSLGWPGMLTQLLALPLFFWLTARYVARKR